MQKRMIAALTALIVLLGAMLTACGGSKGAATPDSAKTKETYLADDFSGVYVSGELFLRVVKRADESYDILAIKGTYNDPKVTWEMTGSIENTVELNYTNCIKTDYTASSDGEIVYSDGTGLITFAGNSLTWRDDKEQIGDGLTFMIR